MSVYAQDGVNVSVGDEMSAFAAWVCKRSQGNNRFVRIEDFAEGRFRGPRGIVYENLPEGWFEMHGADGVGTKVVIHSTAGTEGMSPQDAVAMCCGDITRWGGKPVVFMNVLDVETLGKRNTQTYKRFKSLLSGLDNAAEEAGVVLTTGEIAELGSCIGSENPLAETKFNLAGFAIGINTRAKIIDGRTVRPGDAVIALRENGFRSNGISSVRAALRKKYGVRWYECIHAQSAIRAAAEPSKLYDRMLAEANGWDEYPRYESKIPIKAIAHITGGGIPSKFADDLLFPRGLSAELEDLFDPPEIMKQCVEWRDMSHHEAYRTFNGGQGKLLVLAREEISNFITHANTHHIEAKECGTIRETHAPSEPKLIINNKFGSGTLTYKKKT